jgi:hypothetical protein
MNQNNIPANVEVIVTTVWIPSRSCTILRLTRDEEDFQKHYTSNQKNLRRRLTHFMDKNYQLIQALVWTEIIHPQSRVHSHDYIATTPLYTISKLTRDEEDSLENIKNRINKNKRTRLTHFMDQKQHIIASQSRSLFWKKISGKWPRNG